MAATKTSFDVLICGAGMVGVTAAALFAKQGLRVAILDSDAVASWSPESASPRVSAISIASKKIFEHLDVWDDIVRKRASPYSNMHIWEHDSDASISFNAHSLGQPQLGYIIENNAIVATLIEKLRQNYNVSIFENSILQSREVKNKRVMLHIQANEIMECELLVGADGGQSRVRELSGISTSFHDYQQDAIVTRVTIEKEHQNTAWQCFLPTGPVAMLPLLNNQCSIVWSCDRDQATVLMSLNKEEFCQALSQYFQNHLGRIMDCEVPIKFPLRQHHASHYISPRTALVGDAAHMTHPLAGLGANIGFMDVAALAEVIDGARNNGQSISNQSVLRRYERWRRGENALVLGTMKSFKTMFGLDLRAAKMIRQSGLKLADQMTPVKDHFARYAMGLSGDLANICK